MPISRGLTSRTAVKGEGHIHTDKWHRCIEHVKAQGGNYDPYGVCTASIGYSGSINPEHRTSGKHASTKHRKKIDLVQVLKWNESQHPRDAEGQFAEAGSADDKEDHPDDYAMDKEAEHYRKIGHIMSKLISKHGPDWLGELAKMTKPAVAALFAEGAAVARQQPQYY